MILVRWKVLLLLILLSLAAFPGLSFLAYRMILAAPDLDPSLVKAGAERFFLAGLLGAAVYFLFLWWLIFRSVRFNRILERMILQPRSRGLSPDRELRRMGRIGNQLADIIYEMDRLSEKKSLKIGALNSLCEYLVSDSDEPLGVLNVKGEILYVSRKLTESMGLNRSDMVGRTLGEYFPGKNVEDLVEEAASTRLSAALPGKELSIHPVLNHRKEAAYLIFHTGKTPAGLLKAAFPSAASVKKGSRSLLDRFRRSRTGS